jgi:hypothetical protein
MEGKIIARQEYFSDGDFVFDFTTIAVSDYNVQDYFLEPAARALHVYFTCGG